MDNKNDLYELVTKDTRPTEYVGTNEPFAKFGCEDEEGEEGSLNEMDVNLAIQVLNDKIESIEKQCEGIRSGIDYREKMIRNEIQEHKNTVKKMEEDADNKLEERDRLIRVIERLWDVK